MTPEVLTYSSEFQGERDSVGSQKSVNMFMASFKVEILPKDELARVLCEFQASNDEMKSVARYLVERRLPAPDGRKLTELTFYLLTQFLMFARC